VACQIIDEALDDTTPSVMDAVECRSKTPNEAHMSGQVYLLFLCFISPDLILEAAVQTEDDTLPLLFTGPGGLTIDFQNIFETCYRSLPCHYLPMM